jgi:hypothetical protein
MEERLRDFAEKFLAPTYPVRDRLNLLHKEKKD